MPLTTQYLKDVKDLETKRYIVPTDVKSKLIKDEGLALVSYVQSDCNTPSDRDHFVQMLQKYIKVDSYGACEHNKDLPEQLVKYLLLFLPNRSFRLVHVPIKSNHNNFFNTNFVIEHETFISHIQIR